MKTWNLRDEDEKKEFRSSDDTSSRERRTSTQATHARMGAAAPRIPNHERSVMLGGGGGSGCGGGSGDGGGGGGDRGDGGGAGTRTDEMHLQTQFAVGLHEVPSPSFQR